MANQLLHNWKTSRKSHVWIFNVARGLCVFIRTPLNHGLLYDFGSSADFNPTIFLEKNILPHVDDYYQRNQSGKIETGKLAQTIISHPHADHISKIECLIKPSKEKSSFYSVLHTCPHSKLEGTEKPEAINWERIKNPSGSEIIETVYKDIYSNRKPPLRTLYYDGKYSVPNVEYGLFYVRPPIVENIFPKNDQEYGNGISLVFYFRHGNHTILFPGDINPEAFKHILFEKDGFEKRYTTFDAQINRSRTDWHLKTSTQPSLSNLLNTFGLSVLVAPHHGLESGFSEDLFNVIKNKKPGIIAISEKRHNSKTDGKVDQRYQSSNYSNGQYVTIEGSKEFRNSVTTREGHHILCMFQGTGGAPEIFLEKDAEKLMQYLT